MKDQEKRGKVIKGLGHEIERTNVADLEWLDCVEVSLLRDALELLKAQEPVEPALANAENYDAHTSHWYQCGACLYPIDYGDKYCRHCGKAVRWD